VATGLNLAVHAHDAGKNREVDFLVTYRGRAGVVEVDGDTHRNRYAADQSRDRFLRDAGINVVERIVAEDSNDPAALDLFVKRFLNRLIAR
jgi:very-short-patch-repair endonuclease